MNGTVKWFDSKKGYGFLIGDDGTEIFIHQSQIKMDGFRALNEGDIISFEIGETNNNKGVQAVNVEPILTLDMIKTSLKKENLYIKPIRDIYGCRRWIVVDKNNVIQSNECGMYMKELAAYAGFSVSEE